MSLTDILAAQIQSSISNGILNQASYTDINDTPYGYTMPNIPQKADRITAGYNTFDTQSFPLDQPKYYMNLNFAAYKRNSINAVGNLSTYRLIRLPLPDNLTDMHGVSWQADALGWSGALTTEGLKALSQGNYSGGALAGAGVALQAGRFAQGVAGRVGRVAGAVAEDVLQGGQALIGVAPNKFMTVLFKGPQYRSLQFNWRLAPRNKEESNAIRTIVKNINNAMSPSISPLSQKLGSILFGYPDVIMMEFRPNAKFLYKFKPAVITAFSANYSPGGSPAFYHGADGAPEGIDISMRTMELEYWLGNDERGIDGDFTDSNDTGDVYGGTYGTNADTQGQSKGLNSRQLGSLGGGGGLPERENQSGVLSGSDYSIGSGGTDVTPPIGTPGYGRQ